MRRHIDRNRDKLTEARHAWPPGALIAFLFVATIAGLVGFALGVMV